VDQLQKLSDPHVQPSRTEAPAYFEAKCAACHTDKSCKVPMSTRQQQKPRTIARVPYAETRRGRNLATPE